MNLTGALMVLVLFAAPARADEWFHGDFHEHIAPPDLRREVFATGDRIRRDAAKERLDFMVLTPHLWHNDREKTDAARIARWLEDGADLGRRGTTLFIPGYEDTRSVPGHLGVTFLPPGSAGVIAECAPRLALRLGESGALVFLNHPLGLPPAISAVIGRRDPSWRPFTAPGYSDPEADAILEHAAGMEVMNASIALAERLSGTRREETHVDRAFRVLDREILRQRRRMVGIGGSDNHNVLLTGTTWVRARELTPEALREAVLAGRVVVGGKAASALEAVSDLAPAPAGTGANLPAERFVELRFPGAALVWRDGEPVGERRGVYRDESVRAGELHVYRVAIGDSYGNPVYVNLPEVGAAEGLR